MEYVSENSVNTVLDTQKYDDGIVPVTDIQKHWKVLTFHENRLNRLDHHIRETAKVNSVEDMETISADITELRNSLEELRRENENLKTSLNEISSKVN